MNFYVTIGTNDPEKSHAFYDAVLATIGWGRHAEFPGWCGYSDGGKGDGFSVWVGLPFDGKPASHGNGSMTGLAAKSPAEVHAFHQAALAHGGKDEGAPGPRPQYGPDWYAAYVRDPEGNKIAIVFNGD